MTGTITLTIVVLGVFVGLEVASRATTRRHPLLLSSLNALNGVLLAGAVLFAGQAENTVALLASLVAVVFSTIALVGGFIVTLRAYAADRHPEVIR